MIIDFSTTETEHIDPDTGLEFAVQRFEWTTITDETPTSAPSPNDTQENEQ